MKWIKSSEIFGKVTTKLPQLKNVQLIEISKVKINKKFLIKRSLLINSFKIIIKIEKIEK